MNEDLKEKPIMSDLHALFVLGSEKQKYQASTVVCYMMLLLKYDLIKLRSEECK